MPANSNVNSQAVEDKLRAEGKTNRGTEIDWRYPTDGNTQGQKDGKCPDGYADLYANICIRKSIKDKTNALTSLVTNLSLPEGSMGCNALAALMAETGMVAKGVLELPMAMADMVSDFLSYSFDSVTSLINSAMDGIIKQADAFEQKLKDAINSSLDELEDKASEKLNQWWDERGSKEIPNATEEQKKAWMLKTKGKAALMAALDTLPQCSAFLDSSLGQLLSPYINNDDKIYAEDEHDVLESIRNALSSYVAGVNAMLASGPLGAIASARSSVESAISNLGLDAKLSYFSDVQSCLQNFCAAYSSNLSKK